MLRKWSIIYSILTADNYTRPHNHVVLVALHCMSETVRDILYLCKGDSVSFAQGWRAVL